MQIPLTQPFTQKSHFAQKSRPDKTVVLVAKGICTQLSTLCSDTRAIAFAVCQVQGTINVYGAQCQPVGTLPTVLSGKGGREQSECSPCGPEGDG